MKMHSCDRHKGRGIVFADHPHKCPVCMMEKAVDTAGRLTEEALNMIDIEDSAEQLAEVAQVLLKGMKKLRES